jgi:Bacteriocin-protection, YdeI or OmpD-Associated/Domain of unknown function (DUF1905)
MRNPRRFLFTVPLVRLRFGGTSLYILEIPERVSTAIGRRGPVPIIATLNKAVEIQASLVPNGRWEAPASAERAHTRRIVPERPPRLPLPSDLAVALKEVDFKESFAALPVGKQNHIILWIEEAARPETRAKRIATVIEMAFRARERVYDRKK